MNPRKAIVIAVLSPWLFGCGGPESPRERGYVHLQLGQWQESIEAYNEALEIDPADAEAWTGRGRAQYSLGHVDAAMSDYNRAIDVDPQYSEAYYLRAVIYQLRGETKLAESDRLTARQLDPATKLAKLGEPWSSPAARLPAVNTKPSKGVAERSTDEIKAAAIKSDRSANASRGEEGAFEDDIDDTSPARVNPKRTVPETLTLEKRIEQRMAELDSKRRPAAPTTTRPGATGSQHGAPKDVGGRITQDSLDLPGRRIEGVDEDELSDVGIAQRNRNVSAGNHRHGTKSESAAARSRPPRAARNPHGGLAISPFDLNPFGPTTRPSTAPTMGPSGPPSISPFSTPTPSGRAQPPSPLVIGPATAPSQSPFGRPPTTMVAPTGSAPVIGPSGPPSQSPFAPRSTAQRGSAASAPVIGPAGPPQHSPFARPQAARPLQLFQPVSPQ